MQEFKKPFEEDVLKSGFVLTPPKHTDYLYSAIAEPQKLPTRYFAKTLPPLDQKNRGYCWAFTVKQILDYQDTRDENKKFSLEYEVRKTKHTHGDMNTEGETIDSAFSTVTKYGAMLESDLPYLAEFPPQNTTSDMDLKALKNKHASYVKGFSVQEIKQMVYNHEAVGFAIVVSEGFYNNLRQPTINGEYVVTSFFGGFALGGHLFIGAVGYDDEKVFVDKFGKTHKGAFLAKNTWSGWGHPETQEVWITYSAIEERSVDIGVSYFHGGITFVPKIENPSGVARRKVQLKVGSTKYTVNGFEYTMEVAPFIEDSRTLCPVRFIAEGLGYGVSWNESSQTVTINDGKTKVDLQIGSKNVVVNGVVKTLDVAPKIVGNRTFVPLRFVSEALGLSVDWRNDGQIITIIK